MPNGPKTDRRCCSQVAPGRRESAPAPSGVVGGDFLSGSGGGADLDVCLPPTESAVWRGRGECDIKAFFWMRYSRRLLVVSTDGDYIPLSMLQTLHDQRSKRWRCLRLPARYSSFACIPSQRQKPVCGSKFHKESKEKSRLCEKKHGNTSLCKSASSWRVLRGCCHHAHSTPGSHLHSRTPNAFMFLLNDSI
jgi:hypothetical protein